MRFLLAGLALGLVAGCTPAAGFKGYYLGHPPTVVVDGQPWHEWHNCPHGGACMEGYACMDHGCEWCGGPESAPNKCTGTNDEYPLRTR